MTKFYSFLAASAAKLSFASALLTGILFFGASTIFPTILLAQYTAGNLVVLQVGDGTTALANTGNPVLLREFTPAGAAATTVTIPSTGANPLIIGGTATTEGLLTRASDGLSLVFGGYAQVLPNSTALSGSTAAAINRAVGSVSAAGVFTRVATSGTFFSGNSIRGVATNGSNHFWASGGNDGTDYFGTASAATNVQNIKTNTRAMGVFNGKLYFTTQSAAGAQTSLGLYQVGSGLPVTAGQTIANIINTGTGTQPSGFFFNAAGTICYIADQRTIASGGGIQKWTFDGSAWTLAYTLATGAGSTVGAFSVAVDFAGANPVVYATTTESASNRLIKITDTGIGSASTTLATATTNTIFRGVSFAPAVSCPSITAAISGTATFCLSGSFNFSVSITGGTGPYTVVYTDGTTNFTQPNYTSGATITRNVTQTTTFTLVSVTDAAGCTAGALTGSATATVATNPPTVTFNVTQPGCANNDGAINTTVTNGNPPLVYAWATSGGSGLVAGQQNQTGLSAGIYTVTVTDAAACTGVQTTTLSIPPGCGSCASASVTSVTNINCTTPTGAIVFSAAGGNPPYQFNIGSGPQASGAFTGLAAGTYTVTVTDAGNCTTTITASATVQNLPDTQAPTFNLPLPQNITIACTDPIPAVATVTASDNCPGTVTVTFAQTTTPGSCPQAQTITRRWTATDVAGNSAQYTQTISIVDNVKPVLSATPADVTIACTVALPTAPTVTATDNCDTNVPVSFNETIVNGACPQNKTVTRTWTATDDCGNSTSAVQVISVVDNVPPVFNQPLPANITISCAGGLPMAPSLTATDNCDPGQVPPVIFINEIHYDNIGTDAGEFIEVAGTAGLDLSNYMLLLYNGNGGVTYNMVTLSGTIDNEGNGFGAVSFSFPVDGIQNGSPDGVALVSISSNSVLQFLSYEGPFMATNGLAMGMISTDIGVQEDGTNPIGTSVQLTGTGQTSGQFAWVGPLAATPGALNAGQTLNPLPATITATLMQSMMMGNCNGSMVVMRVWTATDACGNSAQYTQTISVVDNSGPVFAPPLPANITINCTDPVPVVPTLIATDVCDMGTPMLAWINEIHYDNLGNDVGEFIEIAGPAGTNLAEYSLFLYNGTGGGTYGSMTLSGTIDNESNGFGAVEFTYPTNGIQNGPPDGIALIHTGMVVQYLSYEGVFMAVGGPANFLVSTDIGVLELGTELPGQSLRLSGTGNVYSNFVWNGPSASFPATPGALNQGQIITPLPPAFPITFNQTVSGPPANCPYGQTITRTWGVADNCGNLTTHQQIITVTDNKPPVVSCQPITVTLNIFGQGTVNQSQIVFTATDNCSPSTALVVLPNSVTYTCANAAAPPPFVLSVRDQCGNIGTCNVAVTIPALARCVPKISISDPCICKNNATTLENGEFGEVIKIESLAGKVWTVTASNGLFSAVSAGPPSPPITIIGEKLIENPLNSGDYYLNGIHVDALGYTVTITSGQGETLTIGNSCAYPNPEITSNLDGPFCLYSPDVTLTGTPGDFNIVSQGFTINGVPATIFDPGKGVGQYIITYTVNGGVPKASGASDPGCIQKVTKIVNVINTPDKLTCNDHVYVSLDADCTEPFLPDDILEGSYGCYDDYEVKITTIPAGNPVSSTLTSANIGQTYKVSIKHLVSGANCWGLVTVEDKLPPVISNCQDITVTCAVMDFTPNYLKNTLKFNQAVLVVADCSPVTTTYKDTWVDLPCGAGFNGVTDLSAYIKREWLVKDPYNNFSTCTQYIYLKRRHVDAVKFPADITLDCTASSTEPDVTGAPYFEDFGLKFSMYPNTAYCELNAIYNDKEFPVCGASYKIIRTWTVYDWCLPTNPGPTGVLNPVMFTQVIKVTDSQGPSFTCPAALTVSTDVYNCCGTINLPDVVVMDNCSKLSSMSARVEGTDPVTFVPFKYTVAGGFSNFPNNDLNKPDTLGVIGTTPCLPLGAVTVTYRADDECGNSRTCAFQMTLADQTLPYPACIEFVQVSLGANGQAVTNATSFDNGSYDNCSAVTFRAGRSSGSGSSTITFSCSDLKKTITVFLTVTDAAGNTNECMVNAFVDDKIKPICNAPANLTVSCENFDPTLKQYPIATATDNCAVDKIVTTLNYTLFDTLCNRGTITRTYMVTDKSEQSSQCSQRIFVDYEQDYFVKFPDDKIVTVCDGTGNFGEPSFLNKDCELLGVSYTDEVFTVVPDACFKIERTWHIINWCFYNANLGLTVVPNPNPNATVNAPANNLGPVVSSSSNPNVIPAPWTATRASITPGAPPTDFSTYWSLTTNGYSYKQIIKVIDGQDPVIENCPGSPVEVCDLTPNAATLWNETYWWDNKTMQHDLCEGPTDLTITATDACSNENLTFRYLLFLDLDGNGSMETVVSSSNLPGFNAVNYNNASNPNFTGGTPQAFDERSVPNNEKYGFALQVTTQADKRTAAVRWNTQQAPSAYTVPELPYGTHKIKWIVEDGCGNESVCEYTFIVKDCKAPTVVCTNGLSVNIMPSGMISLWASDFMKYAEDNCTPANKLKIGIRKAGTGSGFPVDALGNPITSVTFTCAELGKQEVEVWAMDLAGNADFCVTYVLVQDNAGDCDNTKATVAGALQTESGDGLEETTVELTGSAIATQTKITDQTGAYKFNKAVPMGSNMTITPANDNNPLNGVSTYDLVLISKHILGLEPLSSPYKMICADANRSGSITTFDIVELRKLILGIYTELPGNTSWRFIDKTYNFADPSNPFKSIFPENISVANVQGNQLSQDFYALKVGDVNGSAVANSLTQTEDRNGATLLLDVDDRSVQAGESFELPFKAAEAVQGFQFTLNLNGLELIDIVQTHRVSPENFGSFADALTVSVDGASEFTLKFRAVKAGRLSDMLGISSRITPAEAYGATTKMDVALRFISSAGSTTKGVGFELYQNEPNPFVNKTFIGFHLPEATSATLTVRDETGRTLFTQKGDFAKGYNKVAIEREHLLVTGVLYYTLETATNRATKKMIQSK